MLQGQNEQRILEQIPKAEETNRKIEKKNKPERVSY